MTLWKTSANTGLLLMLVCSACKTDPPPPLPPPQLVIIGEDLSGTYVKHPETTTEDMIRLCNALGRSEAGGKVYLIGIGNSTPKGYAFCEIKPLDKIDKSAVAHEKRNLKIKNAEIKKHNKLVIDEFIEKAETILSQHSELNTNINGFLEKVAAIVDDPVHKGYETWLFINSDGKQDTKDSKKINCSLLPTTIKHFFVSKGWEGADCGHKNKTIDTQHFVTNFIKRDAAD